MMEVSGLMSQAYALPAMGAQPQAGARQPMNTDVPLMASSLEPKAPQDKPASPSVSSSGNPIGTNISVTA